MQQSLAATLLTLLAYLFGLLGGGSTSPGWLGSITGNGQDQGPLDTPPAVIRTANGLELSIDQPVAVNSATANIRSQPSTKAARVAVANRGTVLRVLKADSDWLYVRLPNSKTGWVSVALVRVPTAVGGSIGRPNPGHKEVIGYYATNSDADTDALQSLVANANVLTGVAPFSFSVDSYGNVDGRHDARAMSEAKRKGIATLALVHNYTGDRFDSSVISSVLESPSRRSRLVTSIAATLRAYGYQGVNIDFENVPARDRDELSVFLQELAQVLHRNGFLATISVPAKTEEDSSNAWSGAFDYAAIGRSADRVMVMAYDENYRVGPPGPVASIGWVEKVIRYSVRNIPSSKVILGVAGYGYNWPLNGENGYAVSTQEAESIARRFGVSPSWSDEHKVPYITYRSGSQVRRIWYEDSDSLAYKLRLVDQYGLRGIALWRLGYEDPQIWSVLAREEKG